MKVLVVHNFYQSSSPSGENQLVLDEIKLLESQSNIQLKKFFVYSDDFFQVSKIRKLQLLLNIPWNISLKKKLKKVLEEFNPDVVHVHNTFPFISPSLFYVLRHYPIFYTLHNYRIFCAAGTPLRDGKICLDCFNKKSFLPGLKNNCYRGSKIKTILVFLKIYLAKLFKIWERYIDTFFVFSDYQKNLLSSSFLNDTNIKFVKKPNFMFEDFGQNLPISLREDRIVFIGRLSQEKGLFQLIDAWNNTNNNFILSIVGDGPLMNECKKRITNERVRFEGKKSKEDVLNLMKNSCLTVIPSICIEGFPMTLAESFSVGTPVLCSNYGPLPEYIANESLGYLIDPNDIFGFAKAIDKILLDKQQLENVSRNCKKYFLDHLSAQKNVELLLQEYSRVTNKIQIYNK